MRTKLFDALSTTFKTESVNAVSRLKDNIAPYTRFVYAEVERIQKSETTLNDMLQQLATFGQY